MKPSNSSKRNEQIFVVKQVLFALQIIIICAAIPLLSYLQLTYKSNKKENVPRSAMEATTPKHNSTARSGNTSAPAYPFAS
jgi:hypothetical protein